MKQEDTSTKALLAPLRSDYIFITKRQGLNNGHRDLIIYLSSFSRRNDSGGSAHSAFGPLLPNGTPSQLVPKYVFFCCLFV